MTTTLSGVTGPLRWAVLNRPLEGEVVSGDRHLVVPAAEGALVAVIDGLGHGREAAEAAAHAVLELRRDPERPVEGALQACHRALGRTRGAVMSIVRVRQRELSWVGVGNVETILVPGMNRIAQVRLLLLGGVVGHSLPSLRPTTTPIARGDLLVLATDGLRSDVMDYVEPFLPPEAVVNELMAACRTGRDDALAFAARFDGTTT